MAVREEGGAPWRDGAKKPEVWKMHETHRENVTVLKAATHREAVQGVSHCRKHRFVDTDDLDLASKGIFEPLAQP